MGFIHDRNIKDCLCIASKAVNLLHNKSFGAEDVLSRSISKLVSDGKLDLIKGTRHMMVPSHTFYADDLMVFCKGKLSGLTDLKDLFNSYALQSGQVINTAKSTIYSGSITQGKPKSIWLQPLADKIHAKLSAWKASLLTMAGRVQLVRAVIQSMLTYSITLYSWPISLLKDLETNVRNFVWSGDVEKRKLVTVSWKKSAWAQLLRDKVFRGRKVIQHHIYSSLWSSIKEEVGTIFENSIWLLGNGENINFWTDNWCGTALCDLFNIPPSISRSLTSTVSDYIHNGQWNIPSQLAQQFNNINNFVHQVTIPREPSLDQLIWKHSDSGDLQLSDAYQFKLQPLQELPWAKVIWSIDIPPSKSLLVWRLMHNKNLVLVCKLLKLGTAIQFYGGYVEVMNQARFHDKPINLNSVITTIIANSSLSVPLFPREFTIITKITIRCSSTQALDFLAQVTQDLRLPTLSHTRQRDFLALITQDQRLPCSSTQAQDFLL
ncbi:hypothetical protein TSUD_417200 [Trifolium subterraneum]|uniref:Reverse transcriptase zinc-binding domain-containing protein n=1 Tax=Trifolium subterraneum TaxID=3900 RepID=A0A2Z6P6F2_TRISU|nr:hypothetical protein TSUD_417200 [Trifolium subterraneum]